MGGLGIKTMWKQKKKQASECVINYLNNNKLFVALSTICDTFLHINK